MNDFFWYTGFVVWGSISVILVIAIIGFMVDVIKIYWRIFKCPFKIGFKGTSILHRPLVWAFRSPDELMFTHRETREEYYIIGSRIK